MNFLSKDTSKPISFNTVIKNKKLGDFVEEDGEKEESAD